MIRVALAQLNLVVGDLAGNVSKATKAIEEGRRRGAQICALPELTVTGYPPDDLLMKPTFVRAQRAAMDAVAAAASDVVAVVGFVEEDGGLLYNAAAICEGGAVRAVYRKHRLPNYGVFDERRYFEPGGDHVLIDTPEGIVGVCVCEDIWFDDGPAISQGDAGAQLIVNINASPFNKGKLEKRTNMLAHRAERARASIAYVNCIGGQDELVFDGGSMVIDPSGTTVARLPQFEELIEVVDVPLGQSKSTEAENIRRLALELPTAKGPSYETVAEPLDEAEEVYRALTLATRDYVLKNDFDKVVIGLSGGIDSTLVAVLAADAVGPEQVLGVAMPSEYSSSHSLSDAKELATNLGISFTEIAIRDPFRAFASTLKDVLGEHEEGLAEENLQARIRGNLLMFISNRYGHLVLVTGNKSEGAVGYATLYGDMAGGFAVIKDLFKHQVYALCRYRNSISPVIPEGVLTKAPSAELRPGQKDEDSLPPYEVLDPILEAYIERDAGVDDIVALGYEAEVVEEVITLVDRAEFKRRQAAPGPKVTVKAFGRDRRLPITNRWTEGPPERVPDSIIGVEGTT